MYSLPGRKSQFCSNIVLPYYLLANCCSVWLWICGIKTKQNIYMKHIEVSRTWNSCSDYTALCDKCYHRKLQVTFLKQKGVESYRTSKWPWFDLPVWFQSLLSEPAGCTASSYPELFFLWFPSRIHGAHMLPKTGPAKYTHEVTWWNVWEVQTRESQESRDYALQKEFHNICFLNGLILRHICGWIWPMWSSSSALGLQKQYLPLSWESPGSSTGSHRLTNSIYF